MHPHVAAGLSGERKSCAVCISAHEIVTCSAQERCRIQKILMLRRLRAMWCTQKHILRREAQGTVCNGRLCYLPLS